MNIISKVIAGGVPAIAAAGGAVMYAQHELHYLLRPSVIETLAGITAVGGGCLWASKAGKAKAAKQVDAQARADEIIAAVREALPQGQPAEQPFRYERGDKRVIDLGRVER
jgi:hypothetical protein